MASSLCLGGIGTEKVRGEGKDKWYRLRCQSGEDWMKTEKYEADARNPRKKQSPFSMMIAVRQEIVLKGLL
jgi:hypothetical protein